MRRVVLRRVVLSGAVVFAGCVSAPPPDNPAASPRAEHRNEIRGLEQAEAECARQGKHAEAQRIEGETIYQCVD